MNLDNQRLKDIKELKNAYNVLISKSDTIKDCIHYQNKIDELEVEEKQILERFDVII